jgi:GDP-L-fucose synthase
MLPTAKVYVAGHRGFVGSALVRRLRTLGFENLIVRTRQELDLTDGVAVDAFFADERPEYVFLAAARVGGIYANTVAPADFIRENLAIELNVIDAAHRYGVEKLLFLGSSCVYPRDAEQPLRESSLLSGKLEPTNEPYAIAKIAGVIMCQAYARQHGSNFITAMPPNLFGPDDNFDLGTGHVVAALIRKFHDAVVTGADVVEVWGSGTQRREFLHVDDLADACVFLMQHYDDPQIINVGTGEDQTIRELADLIAGIAGFTGKIVYDRSRPDGTPRKVLDTGRLKSMGWTASIGLDRGMSEAYRSYSERAVIEAAGPTAAPPSSVAN